MEERKKMKEYPFTKDDLLAGVEKMNSFGTRPTGSPAHREFVSYLKDEIHAMGFETISNEYKFDRWQAKSSSIVLHNPDGDSEVHVSSPFPYSGETDENGVSGRLIRVRGKHINFAIAKDNIAVVEVKDFMHTYSGIAFDQKNAFPAGTAIPKYYKGPVASAFVKFPFLAVAAKMGVKAVICVWERMSDAMVEGQYLNFILGYQGIPAVWVNSTDGEKIIAAAEANLSATVTLTAEREKDAETESFCSIIYGENTNEAVVINTHTDGVNCVEENGAIAMLAMMRYFKEHKPKRTLIFVFVTGHFRLPVFKSPNGISDQATSMWLHDNKGLWDGRDGHMKVAAAITPEHMGCTEWKDVDGVYKKTNDIDIEEVYTGNETMEKVYWECVKGRERLRTVTLKGHNFLHFGEGQPFFNVGIPEISLVTSPDYLCVESESHEMEKFDPELMYEQTLTFIRIAEYLDGLTADEIGSADKYSLGVGRIGDEAFDLKTLIEKLK